jgi:pSer/pThr/pTyr-binding forkhead associated (FHA) protein
MARLVVLSEGFNERAHELKVEKTTIGRVDDNVFQVPDQSVSSHHCEIILRGTEVVVKDLNSTNGSYINGKQVTEAVLQPGQILRLGQVEMKLESEGAAPVNAGPASGKKVLEAAQSAPRGVKLNDLDPTAKAKFDASKAFPKKTNKWTKIFIIGAVVLGLMILALLAFILFSAS